MSQMLATFVRNTSKKIMGLIQSCLAKRNKVGVSERDETEAYGTVQQSTVVDAKGGVTFDVTFETTGPGKSRTPQFLFVNNQKEDNFEEWRENQERMQEERQSRAKEKRHEVRVLKQIEMAHREMDRLEKFIPLSNLSDEQQRENLDAGNKNV
ncbi:uncharacterized protein LOC125683906 [Ostrea edulis]|uniref:uncharacterized protein LOC125683906 n=1 Tax=Ostrea edulis TaxID=37623 RepID=UPI0024AF569F|nr:uncharacterized protein LOC125683906 [Ostrea edulis]